MMTIDDYRRWLESFRQIGLPAICLDTSARILAIVHSLGNNAQITHCPQLIADLDYIRKVYNVDGGEVPSAQIVKPLQHYITDIEESDTLPKWCDRLFKQRYGIQLYK